MVTHRERTVRELAVRLRQEATVGLTRDRDDSRKFVDVGDGRLPQDVIVVEHEKAPNERKERTNAHHMIIQNRQ